jgi:hypothetical protein
MNGANGHEMRDAAALKVLNRLLILFQYSLASYLRYADPWTQSGKVRLLELVRQLTADHQAYVVRIGQLILKRRGTIERGQFSMRFTAYNDLALDYLAQRLVEHERELIDEIGRCVAALDHDLEARQLAEDILARETQHFQTLTKLVSLSSTTGEPYPATSTLAA